MLPWPDSSRKDKKRQLGTFGSVVALLMRRISFENGDYFGKSILGEMHLCSRFMKKFSHRV